MKFATALMPAGVPVLGPTLMRLRNRFVSDLIMKGGVASADALPLALAKELYEVGARAGHYQGFLNLLAHERRWPEARNEYPRIKVPVLSIPRNVLDDNSKRSNRLKRKPLRVTDLAKPAPQ